MKLWCWWFSLVPEWVKQSFFLYRMQNISLARCFLPCWPFIPINQVNKTVASAAWMTEYRLLSVGLSSCGYQFKLLRWKFLRSFLCLTAALERRALTELGWAIGGWGAGVPAVWRTISQADWGVGECFKRQKVLNTQGCFLAFEDIVIHHWICSYIRLNFLDLFCL